MEKQKKYDIFISYRREGGKHIARLLKTEMELRGYYSFLDFDELKDGRFDKRIMDAIDAAPIFMFILSKHALDRCVDENDWVRKEIEYAMQTERHIIPINPDKSFDTFELSVPQKIREGLGQHQFSQLLIDDMFNSSMDKLVEDRLEPILGKRTKHEMSVAGAIIHLTTDVNCEVYRFGKHECNVVVGEDKVLRLKKGKHKLEFVSIDNDKDKYGLVLPIEDVDTEDFIEITLQHIVEKRIEAELACQRAEEEREEERKRKAVEEAERIRLEEEAKRKQLGNMSEVITVNGVSFSMIKIQGGTFAMGATSEQGDDAFDDERPVHHVTLSDYMIGETVVTQELWQAVMGCNPSYFYGTTRPVEKVSWYDCNVFITRLNSLTGRSFRLPTEAEWEYAARGGQQSKGYRYAGSNTLGDVAWYDENSNQITHPVKQKMPNELGLYDMSGNVLEWCNDMYDAYGKKVQTNPIGTTMKKRRVFRGGCWSYDKKNCRVAYRNYCNPIRCSHYLGLRLAL